MFIKIIKNLLAHPLTRGMDIDHPSTTILRKRIIKEKTFLRHIYLDWYRMIVDSLPDKIGKILELGSGPGFLEELIPDLITSEVFWEPEVKVVCDGVQLPFPSNSLTGIVMTNVLHHIANPKQFFLEASRCIDSQGRIIMLEPWVSDWSRLVYPHLHHELFEPEVDTWDFQTTGPISSANGALPWIMFNRDRRVFEKEFPQWKIMAIQPMMPFVYLLSGGVSLRSLMPGWSYSIWRSIEKRMWNNAKVSLFAMVVLQKQ
jgi:SAM-dependent methyltransferase